MQNLEKLIRDIYRPEYPGASVYVLSEDDVFHKAFGAADVNGPVALTTNHQFDLASLSKQFTAFAAFELHRSKILDLNTDVAQYLPGHPSLEGVSPRPKVRDLVFHMSGFRDYASSLSSSRLKGWDNDRVLKWLDDTLPKRLSGKKPLIFCNN